MLAPSGKADRRNKDSAAMVLWKVALVVTGTGTHAACHTFSPPGFSLGSHRIVCGHRRLPHEDTSTIPGGMVPAGQCRFTMCQTLASWRHAGKNWLEAGQLFDLRGFVTGHGLGSNIRLRARTCCELKNPTLLHSQDVGTRLRL